jgi:PAS domain S-box-containing protein
MAISRYSILILEDSPEDRSVYCRYLSQDRFASYDFIQAETGLEALQQIAESQPDLILVDYQLPDMDWLEFLNELKLQFGNLEIPVMMLTGRGDEAIAVEAMKNGVLDYIIKSKLTPAGLCRAVHTALEKTQLQRLLQIQEQQQQLLARILLRIRQFLHLDEILSVTVQDVREILKADRVIVYQFDSQMNGTIVAESVLPGWTTSLDHQIQDSCFRETQGIAYRDGKISAISDIYDAGLTACHIDLLERFEVKANLVVPILLNKEASVQQQGEQLWGLLIAHQCRDTREWQKSELDLLKQLSVHLSIAINQAEIYANLQTLNTFLEQKVQARTQELQASERKFRAIFNYSFQMTGLLTREGILLEANQTALNFVGLRLEDVVNRPFWETDWWKINPETQDRLKQAIARASQGEFLRYEVDILGTGGQIATIDFSLRPLKDESGQVVMLIAEGRDISERKQAEEALRHSQQLYRTLVDNFPNGVVVLFDHDLRYLLVGGIEPDNTGLNKAEMAGKTLWEIFPSEVCQICAPYFQQALAGEAVIAEVPYQDFIYLCHHIPVRDDQGNVIAGILMSQNITAQKRTEQERDRLLQILAAQNQSLEAQVAERTAELKQSKERFQNLVETSSDWVWEVNEFGVYTYSSPQVINLLGYSPAEILGKTLFDFMPPAEAERVAHELSKFASVQAPFQCLENINLHQDGRLITLETNGVPIFDVNQQFRGYRGMGRDITLRKQSEAKLQAAELQLRNLSTRLKLAVKSAKIGIWDFDLVNDSLVWDERMYELFGVSPATFDPSQGAREKFKNLLHPDDRVAIDNMIQAVIVEEQEIDTELRVILPNGKIRFLKAYGILQRNCQGQPQRIIGINYDITNRKLAETQLQQTNQQLAASNAELARATHLKDEFLATMSHELRTPLNAILGLSEALQEEVFGVINEKQKRSLQTIERSGQHLLELINDILDLSKIEAGQMELRYHPTAISPLCQSSLAFIKQQAFHKRIQVEVKIQPHLPDLLIDERRIRQVLINLLTNAVKFTPEGGRITFEVTREKVTDETDIISLRDFIRIAVIDTGIGIAPENLHKLFQPFVQIDSALNRQYTGTGLGLSLVKRIVEIHGGQVGVSSILGVGSCFTVDLPCGHICESASELVKPDSPQLNTPLPEIGQNSPLILLAEDNEANILTISGYLEAKGYRMILARDGAEAIALTKTQVPDLMIMDIQMPGVDGIEAIKQIRLNQTFSNTPIIALTALAMPGDREKCLAAGANDYLSKPVVLKQLATTIQQFLAE